jgi:hypothetical protein
VSTIYFEDIDQERVMSKMILFVDIDRKYLGEIIKHLNKRNLNWTRSSCKIRSQE